MRAGGVHDARIGPIVNLAQVPIVRNVGEASAGSNPFWSILTNYWPGESTVTVVAAGGDGPTLAGISGALPYVRKTITVNTHPLGDGLFVIGANPDAGSAAPGAFPPVRAGTTYTFSLWVRSTVLFDGTLAYAFFDAAGVRLGQGSSPAQPMATNQWRQLKLTIPVPATAAMIAIRTGQHAASSVGSTFDATALMVTTTPAVPAFADGDSAGWRWLGTTGGSQSAGYTTLP